jgi:peptidoglycan/xylan/chitin deacetylase (PgdA/CDA1 family)
MERFTMFASLRINKLFALTVAVAFAVICGGLFRDISAFSEDDGTEIPIIMYHSVVKDSSRAGDYVVTTDTLEDDIAYLLKEGYTPIFCDEAAKFVQGRGELPDKPIILSFDDGCYNNFYYVLPILEKYKVKATFSVVGEWCMAAGEEAEPDPAYSCMDLDNLRSMVLSGYCEIANHSWDMHSYTERNGVCRMNGEDESDYRRTLYNDTSKAQKYLEKSGAVINVYAYPYGYVNDETEDIIKELGYEVTLGCEERVNTVAKGDYGCLRNMGRFNRASGISTADFFAKLR